MRTVERSGTYHLVINALFIALTFLATWLINIRLPLVGSGGLIHLGNVLQVGVAGIIVLLIIEQLRRFVPNNDR